MATFTAEGEAFVLNKMFKTSGHELCLSSDPELTEITDTNYFRVELDSVLGDPQDGFISNVVAITFNVGLQNASWWYVEDNEGNALAFGPLPSPQTGEFKFPVGAIQFEAISGG